MTDEERYKRAIQLLSDKGYTNLRPLGQGTYNTVFKCRNPEKETVAAKVVNGSKRDVEKELASLDLIEKIRPPNFEKELERILARPVQGGTADLASQIRKAQKKGSSPFRVSNLV